jgi:acyl-CoA synthetase (AMP-forming)/AMP-acid ligase II
MSLRSFTLYDIFQRNARIYPGKTAVVTADGERIAFKALLEDVDRLAAGLAGKGFVKDDRIAVLALNHHGFFHLFGAAAALGLVVVPVNWRLSTEEIRYILEDAAPKMLVTDADQFGRARELAGPDIAPTLSIVRFDRAEGDVPRLSDLMAPELLPAAPIRGDDPFCIIYTAAVEGKPRGATLSHNNIAVGNTQIAATFWMGPDDAYLNMLPLFHITGLNLALSTFHVGGKNVVVEKFDEKLTLRLTQTERITLLGSFPPILSRLVSEITVGDYDVSSLRHVLGLDGPDNIKPFEEKTDARFWILYGQTETTGLATLSPAMEKPGTAGKQCLLTRIRIVDEADNEVGVDENGEILVRGPLVFNGYWRQDELNARTFRNGWHHTGDMGRIDEEGYLVFAGRKPEKELIKPGGENVYPAEVEGVILQHPSVAEVSVIGVPDPKFGEGIKAVCVLKPGESLTADDLKTFVADRIARYKKPGYVDFVDGLPKTAAGIIDREKVKAAHGGQ